MVERIRGGRLYGQAGYGTVVPVMFCFVSFPCQKSNRAGGCQKNCSWLEDVGIEPTTFRMQSGRSTPELNPLR